MQSGGELQFEHKLKEHEDQITRLLEEAEKTRTEMLKLKGQIARSSSNGLAPASFGATPNSSVDNGTLNGAENTNVDEDKGKDKAENGDDSKKEEEEDPVKKKYSGFSVEKIPIKHQFTNEVIDHELVVVFKDQMLIQYVKPYISGDGFFEVPPKVPADDLFQVRESLRGLFSIAQVMELLGFLDSQYAAVTKKIDNMVAENKVTYRALWYIFPKNKKIYGKTDTNHLVGAEVATTQYKQGIFPSFDIMGAVIKANGKEFFTTQQRFRILPFDGIKTLDELPVKLMTPEREKEFTIRGKQFAEVATGVHYMHHTGYIAQKEGWWGYQLYKADGRCIVDGISFNRINPNSRSSNAGMFSNDIYNEQSNNFSEIPEDKLYMAWPTVLGFSFSAKKWGELTVENLQPVQFDDAAFDRLVLPTEQKNLIRALVENSGDFSDIISGKGGGCIFLLHGSPGVGKTLTAESIAELLHRPLYSVSVGELGTDTVELEKKLREILEVSSSWNAVILLDEADIFLEKRTENDIARNAMVGIFLRLLEYHQGVLFLTTNRVKCFDKAFHSRISIALKYEDLGATARTQIWKNLLEVAGITGLDEEELGSFDLNGRQIRTNIRLALALAKSENVPVNATHLTRTIQVAMQFKTELEMQ